MSIFQYSFQLPWEILYVFAYDFPYILIVILFSWNSKRNCSEIATAITFHQFSSSGESSQMLPYTCEWDILKLSYLNQWSNLLPWWSCQWLEMECMFCLTYDLQFIITVNVSYCIFFYHIIKDVVFLIRCENDIACLPLLHCLLCQSQACVLLMYSLMLYLYCAPYWHLYSHQY